MAENYFGLTDTGRIRGNNEDTFIAQKMNGNQLILACVIDGVGGYNGGEVAAEIAHQQIVAHLDDISAELIPAMINAFKLANEAISARKLTEKELDSMACVATLAVADIENNQFYYAHVGDTRLYLLRDGSLVKISKDHSFVGFLEDSGRLTETEAMRHPKRNEINKALGLDNHIEKDDSYIETGQSPFLPGDMLLLCSDGLSDMVGKEDITAILNETSSLKEKSTKLVALANHNGGKDNITVVLVQNDKAPQRPAATMPAAVSEKKNDTPRESLALVAPKNEDLPASPVTADPATKGNGLVAFLSVLCLVFLASTIWLYLQRRETNAPTIQPITKADTTKARNPLEIQLQDAINKASGDTLLLSDSVFKQPVMLTKALEVNTDSLYIKAKGSISIQRDSAYSGPALIIRPKCKSVILNDLRFYNFDVAINLTNTALQLKGVQFISCRLPVQNGYAFPDKKAITAVLPVIKFHADTLVNPSKTTNGAR
jgi:serine/threonine protein phosphatase PrpC